MIEVCEAQVIRIQMEKELVGKTISEVSFGNSTHRFAFFSAEEEAYEEFLLNQIIKEVRAFGSFMTLEFGHCCLAFSEGLNFYWLVDCSKLPKKYQFSLTFTNGMVLACSVSMYGAIMLYHEKFAGNEYFQMAKEKPSPLSEYFTQEYFQQLVEATKPTISLKGFLATQQRIPGLGNGTLHDILFAAELLPKRKLNTLSEVEILQLYQTLKSVLQRILAQGGRNTEKDFYGKPGGYQTILSSKTYKQPCPRCGGEIQKASYLGGTIYYCEGCQK
ncbi:hypothetical protein [Enterococcus sp. AZ109]|uniref:hypothetical protein n=1 Tax=Enterococcus sp. AZ109 TaxID=2774634 RepID=UPI003F29813C